MRRFVKWGALVLVVAVLAAFGSFEFVLKQKPFATADDYWVQLGRHELTPDVVAQWDYVLGTVDSISHLQKPYFDVPDPYDTTMFKRWVEENKDDEVQLRKVYYAFSNDPDYGWPQATQGVPWMLAIAPITWAAPSVAIIEPGRSAEAAFVVREFIEVLRSPAGWKDYAIDEGWGDPFYYNMQWKGPLLIAEGLYTLMTGDKKRYGPEMRALAHSLYETHLGNLSNPMGEGYSAGVVCEPNHWFPQCNSMGILGLQLYDKAFGVDPKYNVLIGEAYRKGVIEFLKQEMTDPNTGMIYRRWHPYGPQQADKDLSGFSNIFVAMMLRRFEPEFTENMYQHVRSRYIRRLPLGIGAFMLEVPERDVYNQLVNRGADLPGMIGESAINIFLAMGATREFDDKETFDLINEFLTNVTHPYYRQGELRFDETNEEPSGIEGFTVGQLFNQYSGWWLFGKVHLGWETILNHDWSQNRDADGRLLNNP
ncbi:MAG: hypothetical protein ACE5LU_01575 [Anaerolineae bacterium]